MNKQHTRLLRLVLYVLLSSFTQAVFAQQTKNSESAIEVITVTAQKRSEPLSEVPVAVSVLTSEQIDAAFANNIENLQSLVPSLSYRKGNTNRNSALTVRGIGTISFSIAAEPSVSTVVDGVVLGRSGQAFSYLYDLDRVEVLRGPQGTLFGKNASAGVLNITTKRPTSSNEGMVEASVFQGSEYRLRAKFQGELNDDLAASLFVGKSSYQGNLDNTFNQQAINGYESKGLRAMFDYVVSDNTNALFTVELNDADDDCCADIEGLPSGRNPDSAAVPDSEGIVDGVADFDLQQRQVDHDFTTRTLDNTKAFSALFDTELGDYSLTSITAFRQWKNTEYREGDFTSIGGLASEPVFAVPFQLHDVGPQTWRQLSQELRLASQVGESFDWQAGLFFWQMDAKRSFTRAASCQNNNGQLAQSIRHYLITNNINQSPSAQDIADVIEQENISCNANDIVSATANMTTKFNNWAIFGDGKYQLTEDFRLLFGGRYTFDKVSYSHQRTNHDVYGRKGVGVREAALNTDYVGSTDNNNISVKLGGQYDLTNASMLYGTYSQGYKGPGFNVFYNMHDKDRRPIKEESSDAFELGLKYFDQALMLNIAAFKTCISGFQANNFDDSDGTTITRLTNAGDVSTQGIELDFMWQANDALSLSGGLALVDAQIDKFYCPKDKQCTERSGLPVPYSPDVKYSINADYITEFEVATLLLNANYVYTDQQVASLPNDNGEYSPAVILPDYAIVNASLTLSFNEDKYRVSIIGKNLTDEHYYSSYSGDNFRYQVARDADRYFGAQLQMHF
ncbi:TonB-dependent receptor [Thalassotalea sp. PLHSN55]|uniref:TonB-dependent receptor n=1 Tax=Thalassotalea sp. PLHSN55 TaxID=3435888 RepID=UPI003F82D447